MYLDGPPVQLQSAVLPFQLGVSTTLTLVFETAPVLPTLMTPLASMTAAEMYFVGEIVMAAMSFAESEQPLFSWQVSVTEVRAPEAPSSSSDTRERTV